MGLLRELGKLRQEFAGLTGEGDEGEEEEPTPPVEEPPFKIAEMGGYKWPHGKGLSRLDQFQQFMMLNPNVSLQLLQGVSKIIDQSAIRGLLETLVQRGNPQQAAAAQQAIQQGLGGAPAAPLPPVVRPSSLPAAIANGAPPAPPSPPVGPKFTPAV